MKRSLAISLLLLFVGASSALYAQNVDYYTQIVKDLAAPQMEGRGYVGDGVRKAERYIVEQYRLIGAPTPVLQSFKQNINTFPGEVRMSVDGRELEPGTDFVMREFSCAAEGHYRLYYVDTNNYDFERIAQELSQPEWEGAYAVIDFWGGRKFSEFREMGKWMKLPLGGIICTWPTPLKFYKAYGQKVSDKPIVWGSPDFPKDAKEIDIHVDAKFLTDYESNNIMVTIPGRQHDSCFLFLAHYDHLGHFGSALYYPGVNDNASGTAALITLAQHYLKHKPQYDIVLLHVAGEETGLVGSTYFVEHPLVPLSKIRYVINLDMIGDNNPVQYCEVSEPGRRGFRLMEKLNGKKHYFDSLSLGELAANSDHYPFAEKGVPCILFEQEDGDYFPLYHTHLDNPAHLTTHTYLRLFPLLTTFVKKY